MEGACSQESGERERKTPASSYYNVLMAAFYGMES